MNISQIFLTKRPIIGMIHFPPLVGYPQYPGFAYVEKKALKEARILQKGGVDAVMVENNYDVPHKEYVSPEITAMMTALTQKICEETTLPVGVSTLWNDFKTSLGICACTRASFIRVPAFVDNVRTSYGIMKACGKEVIGQRKKLGLKNVAILADIQVKHSEMMDRHKSLCQVPILVDTEYAHFCCSS